MKHLRYCLMTASIDCKEDGHAQKVMEKLGIKYQHATPSIYGGSVVVLEL